MPRVGPLVTAWHTGGTAQLHTHASPVTCLVCAHVMQYVQHRQGSLAEPFAAAPVGDAKTPRTAQMVTGKPQLQHRLGLPLYLDCLLQACTRRSLCAGRTSRCCRWARLQGSWQASSHHRRSAAESSTSSEVTTKNQSGHGAQTVLRTVHDEGTLLDHHPPTPRTHTVHRAALPRVISGCAWRHSHLYSDFLLGCARGRGPRESKPARCSRRANPPAANATPDAHPPLRCGEQGGFPPTQVRKCHHSHHLPPLQSRQHDCRERAGVGTIGCCCCL